MSIVAYVFGILTALVILLVVIQMLRHQRLRERHAIWWIIAGVLALVIGVFPGSLDWAAGLLGISVPANLIFFVSLAILFLVCLQASSELTRLESQSRALAEKLSLLEVRLRDLEHQRDETPPSE